MKTVWIVKGIAQRETQCDYIDSVWSTEEYALARVRELQEKNANWQFNCDEYIIKDENENDRGN